MRRFLALSLLLTLALSPCARALAAPDWLPDPANSQWLVLGGEKGAAEEHGLSLLPSGGEGDMVRAERGGVACTQSVVASRPGYFYVKADAWEQFKAWQGGQDLLLTLRYWDGAPGQLAISYDSSDARVKHDPYPAGVWRRPDAYPQTIPLEGSKTWKTLQVRLELAMFTKRVHGADLRLDPISPDFALAGVAVTRVPRQAAQVAVTQDLRVDRTAGFTSFGQGGRMVGEFVQQAEEPIALEAELANTLSLREGHTVGLDPQASGGAYLHFVESASYKFTVKTPGKYLAWERGFFPWKGGWNHSEGMDGKPGVNIIDGVRTPEEGWQWIKAGEYTLAAGAHTFQLSYEGGARLDLIVFSRADQPPDLATLAPSYSGPTAGEVWTASLKPFDVAAWRQVKFNLAGDVATAAYEYSTNAGQTWTAFDPQQDLSAIKPAGSGKDTLQFHVKLEGKPGGRPPLFGGGSLDYVAGPNNVRYVENSRLGIGLDPYGIHSLFDKRTNTFLSQAPEAHDSLISLSVKPVGDASVTTQDLYSATLEDFAQQSQGETQTVTMKHRLAGAMLLITTMKLLPSGQIEWQLQVDNASPLEVAELRFPVLTGVKLGDAAADDTIFVPRHWGQVWKNPAADRITAMWGPSMRWMALWDSSAGLYLGIEDPRFDDWGFLYGGDASGGVTLAPMQRILAKPQATWKSAVYRLAATGGDWHEGADIYRAYVAQALKPCAVPPHVKWLLDGWQGQNSNLAPFIGWDMVITPMMGLSDYDPYFMAANRQMSDGMDSGYCGLYPYPALGWGTTREFSQKLAIHSALGGMYTPYHNFHLWSPGYGHYGRIGSFPKSRLPADAPRPDDAWYAKAAAYSYDGHYARGETDYFGQYDMAMGSKEWRDWLYDWTQRYLTWGTDGMYYDQFNMIYGNGRLYPDFPTYGCWAPATLEVFSRMKKDSLARNPYYTASGEFCDDVYGQYVDLHMTSGVWNRLDIWYYCNPHQILIDGAWNGGLAEVYGGYERERFIWQCGARFEHMAGPKDNPEEWKANLMALRRAVKCLVYDADFRDTVGISLKSAEGKPLGPEPFQVGALDSGPFRGVSGRWFLFKQPGQSGAVVNLINYPTQPGALCSFSTKETGPVTSAMAFTLDGKRFLVKGTQKGDTYTFPVPEAECSSVVLVAGKLRPIVAWSLAGPTTGGGHLPLTLKISNPTAAPLSGAAALRLPKGWAAPAPAKWGPVNPGATTEVQVSVSIPINAAKGRADVWCDVTAGGLTFSTYSFITVNDPVLVDFRGNPGSYHIWLKNLTSKPLSGTLLVTFPKALSVSHPDRFDLPPEAEVKVPVDVSGNEKLAEIAEMQAHVTVAGQGTDVVRAVMPVIANGAFEMDGAGDLKPDWWMCRKLADAWSYERIHLSPEAHGGKYALMLDPPQEGEKFIRAYPENGCWKPNTKYRLSVWIKAESDKGVYLNVAGRVLGNGQTGAEWKQFTGELTTSADPNSGGWVGAWAYNESPGKAWFDDIVIEEVQ